MAFTAEFRQIVQGMRFRIDADTGVALILQRGEQVREGLAVLRFDVDGQPTVLVATHPPAPLDSKTWENRNEHLQELARYVDELTDPVLVAGDLNTTMWSPYFDDLLEQTTLYETRRSYGIHPTFPASRWGLDLPWPLQVPLDHVLASEEWAVLGCKNGPNVGSDHLPLIVDVELRTPSQPVDAAGRADQQ